MVWRALRETGAVRGALYHVYCRTARGEMVFSAEPEAAALLDTFITVRDLHDFTALAWCIMGNHYHLVLQTADVPLWRTMALIQGRFARSHNRRHGYLGRLWQSRYKARMVDTESYYNQLVAYVHLNPSAAGLVRDPAAWRWSGHRAMIGGEPPRLLNVEQALRGFASTSSEARKCYLRWIRTVAEERWAEAQIRDLPWWAECKDAEEVARVEEPDAETFDGEAPETELPEVSLDELVAEYTRVTGVGFGDLSGRTHRPDVLKHRIQLTAIAVGGFGHRVVDIATLLSKNPGTVSRWLGIAEQQASKSEDHRANHRRILDLIASRRNVGR